MLATRLVLLLIRRLSLIKSSTQSAVTSLMGCSDRVPFATGLSDPALVGKEAPGRFELVIAKAL